MNDDQDLCPNCNSDEIEQDRFECEVCGKEICQACEELGMCHECADKEAAIELGDA